MTNNPMDPRYPIALPLPPQQPTNEEEQEQPQESKPGWGWVGSDQHPDAEKNDDGISDLFDVGDEDDTSDLVSVDLEKDIIDGNLDDLTEVSEEDILGDEETGQVPLDYKPDVPRRKPLPRDRRTTPRYNLPTTSMGRSG